MGDKVINENRHPRRRIRRYLWAMLYPLLLDNYAMTEITRKLREIQGGVEVLRGKMETVRSLSRKSY